MTYNINQYQWMTLEKFCEMTNADLSIVKLNIKNKGSLFPFIARITPKSKILINYKNWLLSVSQDLRAA